MSVMKMMVGLKHLPSLNCLHAVELYPEQKHLTLIYLAFCVGVKETAGKKIYMVFLENLKGDFKEEIWRKNRYCPSQKPEQRIRLSRLTWSIVFDPRPFDLLVTRSTIQSCHEGGHGECY